MKIRHPWQYLAFFGFIIMIVSVWLPPTFGDQIFVTGLLLILGGLITDLLTGLNKDGHI